MKIMHYCQHVLGVGHYIRSMEIASAFHSHEVLFVEGGEPLPDFVAPTHVKKMLLPPIMMDATFGQIETSAGEIERVKSDRRQLLSDAFQDFTPDILIIELFPFGRKYFQFELLPLLRSIRTEKLPVMVVCSLRDILVEKKDQISYENRVIDILNNYFDLVLIHSDPHLIPLDKTFQHLKKINIPLEYTGFVTRKAPATDSKASQGLIVASGGGSNVGRDLLAASIRAVQQLESANLHLRAFMGPYIENGDRDFLTELAAKDSRISLRPFSANFLSELVKADLSISMAGYNTCMDILSTGVKALVHPFPQNREQRTRAKKLEELGILDVLESLEVDYLSSRILTKMRAKESPVLPDMIQRNGAVKTVGLVEKYFRRS